ncbi:hypothetical protein [Priestia sp. YIM B13448]|uniref:hypothetical protein n=1 Tax=Priestia sp. YIM B13448 TaxID=3366308 RepID=UPI00366B4A45
MNKKKADKLLHVQRGAIKELLINKTEEDELINLYRKEVGGETKNIHDALSRLDKATLIKMVNQCAKILEEDIEECFEEYRYSRKPSFRLFSLNPFKTPYSSNEFSAEIKNNKGVNSLNETLETISMNTDFFRNLKILDQQEINNESVEFSFSFEEIYDYIEPNTEDSAFIYELKYGFLWINFNKNYVSISSPADQLTPTLKRVIEKTFNCFVRDLNITEKVINHIFMKENMKRTSLFHPEPPKGFPEKVSISDTNMADKTEHLKGYEGYTVPSSVYEEEIEDNFYSTLGINRNKGKIYLSRQLKASQLQTWGLQRIEQIIDCINYIIKIGETDEIFATISIESDMELKLFSPRKDERNIILELIKGIVYCKKTGEDNYHIKNFTTEDLIKNLGKRILVQFHPYCDECGNHSDIACPECGSSDVKDVLIKKGSTDVICSACYERVMADRIKCLSDHHIQISSIYEGVLIKPYTALVELIERLINKYFPGLGFNLMSEYFYLQNNQLHFSNKTATKVMFKVSELEQFKVIWNRELSDSRKEKLEGILQVIKEKCSKHSNEACIACQNEKSLLCIMKPFITFTDHELHPHHGHEFGDVSFKINIPQINLNDAVFVGMAKSYEKAIVFASKPLGREMIQQFVAKCQDTRTHVLGLICAARLDQGLMAMCEDLARKYNKKIVMWQFEELLQVVDYAIEYLELDVDNVRQSIEEDSPNRKKGPKAG